MSKEFNIRDWIEGDVRCVYSVTGYTIKDESGSIILNTRKRDNWSRGRLKWIADAINEKLERDE